MRCPKCKTDGPDNIGVQCTQCGCDLIAWQAAEIDKLRNEIANYRTGAYCRGLERKIERLKALLREIEELPETVMTLPVPITYDAYKAAAAIAKRAHK